VLGFVGIAIATYPLLDTGQTTLKGLVILMVSMVVVSAASVYYAAIEWQLPNLLINGWQVLIGGILLLPVTLCFADFQHSALEPLFWRSVLWLSIAVSIAGLICWFHLLKADTIRASLWLFLCPLFGFYYAW